MDATFEHQFLHLLKHPEANEEDLHVKQWDPYELSEDGNLVDGITPRLEPPMSSIDCLSKR